MPDVILAGFARTPVCRAFRGAFRNTRPDDLAAVTVRAAVERAGVDSGEVEDVILGCAQPEFEQGLNIGRIAALRAGFPNSVPGLQVNRFCASGLEAIAIAADRIASGGAEVVVAGGAESMSMVQFLGASTRPNPTLLRDHPDTYLSMGLCVEDLARVHGVTREESDAFSLGSHQKALAAQDGGCFDEEIVAVDGVNADEGPRRETSLEALAKLKSAFRDDGILTAGNSSQTSDGAAAVVVLSATRAKRLPASARRNALVFRGYRVAALETKDFGLGPALAVPKLLHAAGMSREEIGLFEFNEAFAAQVLCSQKHYPLPLERVNVNGGAVALGHPLGCTGARQTVTLAHEMARRGERYGVVTMCAALGMGAAALFERLSG